MHRWTRVLVIVLAVAALALSLFHGVVLAGDVEWPIAMLASAPGLI